MEAQLPAIGIIILDDCDMYGGQTGLYKFYVNQFCEYIKDVKFEAIYPMNGEIPEKSDIFRYKGFILTGSEHSVNDSRPWITNTIDFIRGLLNMKAKAPKIFGICFGHQILAKAAGGKVGRNPINKDIVQTETIQVKSILLNNKIFREVYGNRTSFKIMEAHGDSVLSIPKESQVAGFSDSTKYEVVLWNKRAISVQGHPEFNKEFMIDKIAPLVSKYNRLSDNELANNIKDFTDEDQENNKKFAMTFLLAND